MTGENKRLETPLPFLENGDRFRLFGIARASMRR